MQSDTYSVWFKEVCIARGMGIETALVLVKALFQEYWNDEELSYSIEREHSHHELVGGGSA